MHEYLDRWAVPHEQLPKNLFFVRHENSQCDSEDEWNSDMEGERPSELSMMGGITAACPKALINCLCKITNIVDIYRRMNRHLRWTDRRPSCFVSTFGNFHDAVRWGGQFPGIVRIYSIVTAELPPMPFVHVFRPSDFNMLWPKDEYLFLHQIPDRGIECHVILPDYLKTTHLCSGSAPSLPQSTNQSSPDPEPSRTNGKRKREEGVACDRNTKLRTNKEGEHEAVVPTKEDGDGKE